MRTRCRLRRQPTSWRSSAPSTRSSLAASSTTLHSPSNRSFYRPKAPSSWPSDPTRSASSTPSRPPASVPLIYSSRFICLIQLGPIAKFGQAAAFKAKWVGKGDGGKLYRLVDSVVDLTQQILSNPNAMDSDTITAYKKRKLITVEKSTSYRITKGDEFTTEIKIQETDITVEMLASNLWKSASFKKYNFDALGIHPPAGHLHPLLKVRDEFRQIFLGILIIMENWDSVRCRLGNMSRVHSGTSMPCFSRRCILHGMRMIRSFSLRRMSRVISRRSIWRGLRRCILREVLYY